MKDFLEELKWRGMIHDMTPGVEDQLSKEVTTGYIGFDPTSDSLHIGNMLQVMILSLFQKCGHKPMVLIGGATGMVGDPSGKSKERKFLEEKLLIDNQKKIKNQFEIFLDFNKSENKALIVNNYDWFNELSVLKFLRTVGKYISINSMLAKDSVKSRLEKGISYTEFTYQLIQGYDFFWLWKNKNVKIQLGGSDQWGNIVLGTELIRRKENGDAYAITTHLLTKSDGGKFGKTEDGNIWLDPKKTSPYNFYQFWINISDEDAKKNIKIFSLKNRKFIEKIIKKSEINPHERILQKQLAEELTVLVHSKKDLTIAIKTSKILFGNSTFNELKSLNDLELNSIASAVPNISIDKKSYENNTNILELLSSLTNNKIFDSKSEAKRMIKSGGVSINKIKIEHSEEKPNLELLNKKYLLVQKGKKKYYFIIVKK